MQKDLTRQMHSDVLHERLRYDPETGSLTWRTPDRTRFATLNAFTTWRTRFANRPAGKRRSDGYISVRLTVDGSSRAFLAHRLAWFMVHDRWPAGQIDHINGNRSDNRIVNLREVSAAENRLNMKCPAVSSTGVPGVSWCRTTKSWLVRANINRRTKNLGRYRDFDTAVAVRKAAEQQNGYHANHGQRAAFGPPGVTPTQAYTETRPPRKRAPDIRR